MCDLERNASTTLCVVETAQFGNVLFASLVNVHVARCRKNRQKMYYTFTLQ